MKRDHFECEFFEILYANLVDDKDFIFLEK